MAQKFGGRWEIEKKLSEGGQGVTFLVRDLKDEAYKETRHVLKKLKNLKRRDRFEQEVKAMMHLDHAFIVKPVDFDVTGPDPYIVSPYCSGGTLAEYHEGKGKRSHRDRLELFINIADAINHAHSQRVVHRDIKPSNIFFWHPAFRLPAIGDFGLSYFLDSDERLTETHEVVGARYFMAPELEDGRLENVTPAVDVYSLGKVLYWLFSDGRIFSREQTRDHRWDLVGTVPHAYLPGPNPAMEHINRLLDRMIVHDPRQRGKLGDIILAAKRTADLIDRGANPLSLKQPQPCSCCGWGTYRHAVEGDAAAVHNFGFQPVGGAKWRILVCDRCGHVQAFRMDLVERGQSVWDS